MTYLYKKSTKYFIPEYFRLETYLDVKDQLVIPFTSYQTRTLPSYTARQVQFLWVNELPMNGSHSVVN